jgi:glycine cleavage system H protein
LRPGLRRRGKSEAKLRSNLSGHAQGYSAETAVSLFIFYRRRNPIMNIPSDLKYAKSDEWIRVDGNTATIGVSDFAQSELSDVVYVEMPAVGDAFDAGQSFGSVESVKAASEVYLPVAGKVTAVNDELASKPELINQDPYGAGWILKIEITNAGNLSNLLDAAAYQAHCEARKH